VSAKALRTYFNSLNATPNKRYKKIEYIGLKEIYNSHLIASRINKAFINKENKKNGNIFSSLIGSDWINEAAHIYKNKKEQKQNQIIKKREAIQTILNFNRKHKSFVNKTQSAFNKYFSYQISSMISKMYKIGGSWTEEDMMGWGVHLSKYIDTIFVKGLLKFKSIKSFMVIQFRLENYQNSEEVVRFFMDRNLGTCISSSIYDLRDHFFSQIIEMYEEIMKMGYIRVIGMGTVDVHYLKYNPLEGSSYQPIPRSIMLTKSVINIKNEDNKCFVYCCIASRLNIASHAERVNHYNKDELMANWKYKESDFPMKLNSIIHFEKNNSVNINVYSMEKDTKLPIRISSQKFDETINMFLHEKHYSLIKNFSRFCGNKDNNTCPNCLIGYANKKCFNNHLIMCKSINDKGSLVKMPSIKEDGSKPIIQFKDYSKQKRLPVVIYGDFECNVSPITSSHKNVTHIHEANTFRLHIESDVDLGIQLDYMYSGADADVQFVKLLIHELEDKIQSKLMYNAELHEKPILNSNEKLMFANATQCCFCQLPFGKKEISKKNGAKLSIPDKVRDHCHFTGRYEGAAHWKCNIKAHQIFQKKVKIPVVFHNSNYDIKAFIQAFRKMEGDSYVLNNISGVPCNTEIFKCININNFVVIDSYAHLSSSLSTLLENLPDDKKINLKTITSDPSKFDLLMKKGLYPYEMITSHDKLDMPISELKRHHFDSKLTLTKLNDDEWDHVKKVIEAFNMTTFREYHDIYLKIDVLGLADIFEAYRTLSFDSYGLDPAHFIGLPSFTWQAGLKHTKVKLEQITDIDMYLFFEKWKRGGVSVISGKYAKANNKYLPDYDDSKESSYLMQYDCNNLYGYSMCESLPISGFEWVDQINEDDIINFDKDGDIGYILEVDLKYPRHLHDKHNDFPLAAEKLLLGKCTNLAPNLQDKKKYIVHIRNLKYYLKKGLILKKIHRTIKFKQSNWLASYILHNSAQRQLAKNDFEKDYYKLLNNAFYGKTMENVRDRVDIRFCTDEKSFSKHTSCPRFANYINQFKEDKFYLVKKSKKTVTLDKPIYIGGCIMNLSKLRMYEFHYDVMMERYPNAEMFKTDTDSLLYYIKTDDVYVDMKDDALLQSNIEFSNYPKSHFLHNTDRKKIPGLFQDECVNGKMTVISEYVGLRAKSYANHLYDVDSKEYIDKKICKGINSRHLKKRVSFDDYKDCHSGKVIRLGDGAEKEEHCEKIYGFKSVKMQMYSIEQSKLCLTNNDDKRILCEDGIHTYAIGHWRTL